MYRRAAHGLTTRHRQEAERFMEELLALPSARPRRDIFKLEPASGAVETVVPSGVIVRSRRNPTMYRMPSGMGHYFARLPVGRVWGQLPLILFLTRLSNAWSLEEPNHPFGLGDLAHEDGRAMPDHRSHFSGLATDIYILSKRGLRRGWDVRRSRPTNVTRISDTDYDRARTKKLAKLVGKLGQTFPIFQYLFNDVEVQRAVPQIHTDQQDGRSIQHNDHIHIQLRGTHPYSRQQVAALLRLNYRL